MSSGVKMQVKLANERELLDIFKMLPKGVRKPAFWQKLWKKNSQPAVRAAVGFAPIQTGTLKQSIGFCRMGR